MCAVLCACFGGLGEDGGLHQNHLECFFISAVHPVHLSFQAYRHREGRSLRFD